MSRKQIQRPEPAGLSLGPRVLYEYDEERAYLGLEFSENARQITISGGRNGFARLAELLALWTEAEVTFEDEHWFKVKSPDYGLTFYLLDQARAKK